MLNFIFGFDSFRYSETSFLMNLNHAMIFLGFIGLMIFLYIVLPVKSKKTIVITKISFIVLMFTFEIARMLWRWRNHLHNGRPPEEFCWITTFSFEVCALQVWVTIGVIIATFFVDSKNFTLILFKNILLGSAAIGGILSFIAPVHLATNRYFLHWNNIQTNIQHLMLVIVPFYLIKTKELEVRLKNIWMGAFGLIKIATIVIFVSHITGIAFATALGHEGIENVIPYPYFLVVNFIVPFSITFALYLPYEIYYRINHKEEYIKQKRILTYQEKKYITVLIILGTISLMTSLFLPIFLGVDANLPVSKRGLESWSVGLIFIPLIILTISIYYCHYKINKNNDIDEEVIL